MSENTQVQAFHKSKSLSLRLLRRIFTFYFIITLIVTVYQLIHEFNNTKENVFENIKQIEKTLQKPLSAALWDLNPEQVVAILNGLIKNQLIESVVVEDNNSEILGSVGRNTPKEVSGILRSKLREVHSSERMENFKKNYYYQFPINYKNSSGKEKLIGFATLGTSDSVVISIVKSGFILILVNSIIKTLALWVIFLITFKVMLTNPLLRLTEILNEINPKNPKLPKSMSAFVEKQNVNDELALTAHTISELIHTVSKYSDLKSSIEAAEAVQKALLPGSSASIPGIKVCSYYKPTDLMGGDWFYHFYDENKKIAYFFCGDVTGHGIPSALITAVCCGSILSSRSIDQSLTQAKILENMAFALNNSILNTGQACNRLMTMMIISLNLETGKLYYLNAGHNHPFWYSKSKKKVKALVNSGSRLGFTEDFQYKVKSVEMEPGDRVFIYTDGLTENSGSKGEVFKELELKKMLNNSLPLQEALDNVLTKAHDIWKDTPLDDDVTVLFFEFESVLKLSSAA